MRLIVWLALRDMMRDRLHLLCNVAVIVGVIVPLLVLFGVKNGVYDLLIGRLLDNPATLQIDTSGNGAFTEADILEIRGWPETRFATLKTRSLFDYVNVRAAGGREIREAVLVPSGAGDPTLPPDIGFAAGDVAVSDALAAPLGLVVGGAVDLITQAADRPRQLVLTRRVAAVIPADRMAGRTVLADIATLDLIEAFYDQYALPDQGVADGRDLAGRVASFEGMRVFARDLHLLGPLQTRIESRFGVTTQADTRAVEAVLGLGRNLDLALLLITVVAAFGLAATLIFSFWGEVTRKRRMIAGLALRGVSSAQVAAFPVVQALLTAALGLAASFLLLAAAAEVASRLFEPGMAGGIVSISVGQAAAIAFGVFLFVALSAGAAAMRAGRIDPAIVLREAA